MKGNDPYGTIWFPCEHCPEFWCVKHEQHAFECPCPPVNEQEGT